MHRGGLSTAVPRIAVITNTTCYILDKSFAVKFQIPLTDISGISCSSLKDGVMVIHCPNDKRGDFVIRNDDRMIEIFSRLYLAIKEHKKIPTVLVSERYFSL